MLGLAGEIWEDGNGLMAADSIGNPVLPMPIWHCLSLSLAQMAPCDPGSSSWHPEDGPALPWENGESVAAPGALLLRLRRPGLLEMGRALCWNMSSGAPR